MVHNNIHSGFDYVIAILCAADHIICVEKPEDDSDYAEDLNESSAYSHARGGNPNKVYHQERNIILDMVRDELKMDHFYLSEHRIVLVRIDANTIHNPILADW